MSQGVADHRFSLWIVAHLQVRVRLQQLPIFVAVAGFRDLRAGVQAGLIFSLQKEFARGLEVVRHGVQSEKQQEHRQDSARTSRDPEDFHATVHESF